MSINVTNANPNDMDWVNKKYDEVEFQHSDLENEVIAIATVDGEKAGLGRLVQINEDTAELGGMYVFEDYRGQGIASEIVTFLLDDRKRFRRIFCLPFANLKDFYQRYGFRPVEDPNDVPEKILEKHRWCNETYDKQVLLFVLDTLSETTPNSA